MSIAGNVQIEYLIRLLVAGACGVAIGIERQYRMKNAGVRTHFLVAIAAALMMVISKYGFYDVLAQGVGMSCDASRVAAGIITGIGILGGGIIFISKQGLVSGMTTAAGIWVTLGIGMAIGAGMYPVGIECTVITIVMQCVFHMNRSVFKETKHGQIVFETNNTTEDIQAVLNELRENKIEVARVKFEIIDKKSVKVHCSIIIPPLYRTEDILALLTKIDHLESLDF